ncbi:MAG: serine hydrolase domain-containing protein [Acidimicrobiales bacterium]
MPDARLPQGLHGWCHARFAAVAAAVAEPLARGAHHGVAVAVRHRGAPVVDLWGGAFAEDTLVVSFSTTKGPVSTAVHMALERAGVGYDTPVAQVWPEFGRHGKDAVTIRHALCHEAGIPHIRDAIAGVDAMAEWDPMAEAVAAMAPVWEPGTANGYHALSWGWIAGELVRRVDGRPLDRFVAEEIAGPLGLDGCFLGTPPGHQHRLAPVFWNPVYLSMPPLDQLLPADSLILRAVAPRGDVIAFVNGERGRAACVPAITGAFTARSLATVYAALERGGRLDGVRLLAPATIEAATAVQNTRADLVLLSAVRWRLGFMGFAALDPGGGDGAYGHAGLGGSVAMVEPRSELAVAVTLDRLELDLLGDARGRSVVQAAVAAALDA